MCPPQSAHWAEVNWIGNQPHLVIPSTAVAITAEDDERFVATANEVLLYDQDVHYIVVPIAIDIVGGNMPLALSRSCSIRCH